MSRHHPLQWRPLQNPFPLEGEGWDGGGVPLSSSFPRPLLRHSRALVPPRNPRPGPGGKSPTVSRSTTPVIPAPPSVIPAKAGTHGPDSPNNSPTLSRSTTPRHSRTPSSSFPRRREPTAHTIPTTLPPSADQPPSFPRPFFVIPAKAGTHGPHYPNNSPTLSGPTTVIPAPPSSSFPRRREPTARTIPTTLPP